MSLILRPAGVMSHCAIFENIGNWSLIDG